MKSTAYMFLIDYHDQYMGFLIHGGHNKELLTALQEEPLQELHSKATPTQDMAQLKRVRDKVQNLGYCCGPIDMMSAEEWQWLVANAPENLN